MSGRFDQRIARAGELAKKHPESAKLLEFYGALIEFQKSVYAQLDSDTDVRLLARHFPALSELVERSGPAPLIRYAEDHLRTPASREELLAAFWNRKEEGSPEGQFFARVLLQPFAERLVARADLSAAAAESSASVCPFCGSKPVVAVRRGEGDGARRSLLCSLCSLEWPYRRILCPSCGEEQKDALPVFVAPGVDHIRVEACDTCRAYLKSVDLTRQGFAIPEVDELALVAMDVWAEEQGYAKLETNLLGM